MCACLTTFRYRLGYNSTWLLPLQGVRQQGDITHIPADKVDGYAVSTVVGLVAALPTLHLLRGLDYDPVVQQRVQQFASSKLYKMVGGNMQRGSVVGGTVFLKRLVMLGVRTSIAEDDPKYMENVCC